MTTFKKFRQNAQILKSRTRISSLGVFDEVWVSMVMISGYITAKGHLGHGHHISFWYFAAAHFSKRLYYG